MTVDFQKNSSQTFVVGEKYLDREGKYVVVSVRSNKVTGRRSDGDVFEGDIELKARIHNNIIAEFGSEKRQEGGISIQKERMITWILKLEADGAKHTGAEIDEYLRNAAKDLGYSDKDLTEKAQDEPWCFPKMTAIGRRQR